MRGKVIIPSDKSNQGLLDVVTLFTDTVTSTLGPGGKTVIIHSDGVEIPQVTKDGVTVAEAIHFNDKYKESIVQLLKESARKTAKEVGDGTTTSTLIAGKLLQISATVLPSVKSRRQFFYGMNMFCDKLIDYLDDTKKTIINDNETLKNIVNISSNGDEKVVELLGNIVDEVGADGLINVEFANSHDTKISLSDGASIEGQCLTLEHKGMVFDKPIILLVEGEINKVHEIEPALRYFSGLEDTGSVIIAKGFSEEVIRTILVNNSRGKLKTHLVIAEGFASNRLDILRDLSVITQAEVLSTDGSTPILLREFQPTHVGTAERVVVNPKDTMIIPEAALVEANQELIEKTVAELKQSLESNDIDEGFIRNVKRRLSKYTKVATIYVGGATEAEAMETRDRVDDAVCAIASAVNGGIIPGAGSTLYVAASQLLKYIDDNPAVKYSDDFRYGAKSLLQACCSPIQVILGNAGFNVGDLEADIKNLKEDETIDALTGEVVNAYETGIVDPVQASKNAIINAVSIAKTLLDSSAIIVDDEIPG